MHDFTELCQKIRELTLANDNLLNNDIEECHHALKSRQLLLDKLKIMYLVSPEKHQEYTPVFVQLLNWIQEQDSVGLDRALFLRTQNKSNSLKQIKVNKALNQYKKII